MNRRPLTFSEMRYPVTLDYEKIANAMKYVPIVTSDRDKIYIKRKDDNMKDYIVVHWDNNEVGIVLKKSIQAIRKGSDSTVIYFDSNVLYVDDKYEDIIKQYLA